MRTTQNHHRFRLALEALERRDVMAGDVSIDVRDGHLIIRGDERGNGIKILQETTGEYRVQGSWCAGAETIINGQKEATFTGVTRDIMIDLRGGDDVVRIHPSPYESHMVKTEDGWMVNDIFLQDDPLLVPRDLKIDTGNGNDIVDIRFLNGRGALNIDTGTGNDQILIRESTSVGRGLKVATGDGDDTMCIDEAVVRGRADLQTGSGNDNVCASRVTCEVLFASLGAGDDILQLTGATSRRCVVQGDSGADQLLGSASDKRRSMATRSIQVELRSDAELAAQSQTFRDTLYDIIWDIEHESQEHLKRTGVWRNQENPLDVNNDQVVTAIDLVYVVAAINSHGEGPLLFNAIPGMFPDTDGDGQLTHADLQLIIEELNLPLSDAVWSQHSTAI